MVAVVIYEPKKAGAKKTRRSRRSSVVHVKTWVDGLEDGAAMPFLQLRLSI